MIPDPICFLAVTATISQFPHRFFWNTWAKPLKAHKTPVQRHHPESIQKLGTLGSRAASARVASHVGVWRKKPGDPKMTVPFARPRHPQKSTGPFRAQAVPRPSFRFRSSSKSVSPARRFRNLSQDSRRFAEACKLAAGTQKWCERMGLGTCFLQGT